MESQDRSCETNDVDCLRQLLQQAREALAKHDKATACIIEAEPNADGAVSIPRDVFYALGGCMGAGGGSAFVRQPDGKFASRRYMVFVRDHTIAEELSQLITVCGANFPRGIYDRYSIKPDRDAEGMFYAVLFATVEPHLIEELTGPDLPKPWRLIRAPFLTVVRCLERLIESEADGKQAVRRDAGAGQGGEGMNRPPATPEAIAQSVKHFYGLLADHVAAVGDQLELAVNPLLKPHLPTARIRAFAVRCALQSVPCDGLAGPHNPLAGILPGPVKPEVVLSWVHSLAGGMTSNIRAACTRLAQLMPAVEAWVTGESPASAELIAGWGGARERLFKGVEEAFEMLPALVVQAGGLPRPKDVKRTPTPAEPTDLDDMIEILNAPRAPWPPPTVAAELTAGGEKQQPGLTESVEEELRRRRMVPLTTLMRQNNENSYTPGDPEELEIAMEKLGYYTPQYLSMEMEYERSHSEGFSEAHRREESLKQHGRALRMHELDPSLPPVPTFTDNPVVDEKNLWQWCIDAQAPAKPQAGGKKVKTPATNGMTWRDAQGKLLAMREKGEPYTTVKDLAARVGCRKTTLHKAIASSPTLKGWQARHVSKSPSPRAQSLNQVVTDNAPVNVADPAEIAAENEQLDNVFARLIQEATSEERAEWNGLDTEARRDLARTVLEQEKEQAVQESGPERTAPEYRRRKLRGNRLLGRKP